MATLLNVKNRNIRFSCVSLLICGVFFWLVRGCSKPARHKVPIEENVTQYIYKEDTQKSLGKCIFVIEFTKVYFVKKGKFYTMYASVFGRFKPDRCRKSSQRFFIYTHSFCVRGVHLSILFLYETYLNKFFIQLTFACQLPYVIERNSPRFLS